MPEDPLKKAPSRTRVPNVRKVPPLKQPESTPAQRPTVSAGNFARITDTVKWSDLLDKIRPVLPREFRVEVRRPDDLAVFDVILQNLKLGSAPGVAPFVVRETAGNPAYLIVELPAQSFGEQAYLDETGPEVPAAPAKPFPESGPVARNIPGAAEAIPNLPSSKIRMAGKSRLAFTMPADLAQMPLTVDAIMAAIRTWPQRRDVLAAPEPNVRLVQGKGLTGSWLQAVTASDDWRAKSIAITSAFQAATSADAVRLILDAAVRVANQSVSALTSGADDESAGTIDRLVAGEIDALARNIPALQGGDARALAIGALSAKATESLAASRVSLGDDLTAVAKVPFLPVVLAPHAPASNVTALELPYRLIVTPIESARWLHSDQPVTDPRTGRTELWHTR
ncbi:MAG: hypothetical protein QOJ99_5881, partial [Bryobacterales bacterium]|nr:hypothetical protein [Bryobacterales bacterium]